MYTARRGDRSASCWMSKLGPLMRVEGRVFQMPVDLRLVLYAQGPMVALGKYLRD